ncbi:hypothetical protein, partial [Acinetobacter baumannii]|uniref:hypothetical protein n=1 Tax=Acinetobacter baumannii TaxID=470 RepID=UPI0028963909
TTGPARRVGVLLGLPETRAAQAVDMPAVALARGIVDLHGGEILVDSAGPGLGSEFTLRLPLVAGCAAQEKAAAPTVLAAPLRV